MQSLRCIIYLEIRSYPMATVDGSISTRKIEKFPTRKSFANKFGKSFSSLKFSMSKALQSQSIDPSAHQDLERKSMDSQLPNYSLKILQNDIDILQELLDKKDLLIIELTNNSREERSQFEKEKFQLNQKIEQLQIENTKLQKQLHMQ